MVQRAWSIAACCAMIFILSGCGAYEARLAQFARYRLAGLSQGDIRMCAGMPNSTAPDGRGEIWMYEHGGTTPGGMVAPGLSVPTPTGPVSIGVATDGYCRVQIRFVDGKLVEVDYAGQTSIGAARDAFCAPIVQSCLWRKERMEQNTAPRRQGGARSPTAGAH
ncbi:hypothetical protein [Phreatobacter sp. AB_2022a]|uniref:hypothetical protein n=1 Tax=Phreatobacter sp. AB_2022a TaxID=3003134 RepID=UPI0022875C97|nr:hypothetical protein [Phreatobacter sp. AB_2022a]MCZ0735438.1 hypothetical protein [Phreatobacter sp. AB_2022a]